MEAVGLKNNDQCTLIGETMSLRVMKLLYKNIRIA